MTFRILRSLLLAAAFGLFAGAAFAADGIVAAPPLKAQEEKSLLAPDGTLYTVRSGHVAELGLTDTSVISTDNVIAWSFRRPDGSVEQGLVPDTVGQPLWAAGVSSPRATFLAAPRFSPAERDSTTRFFLAEPISSPVT